MTSPQLIGITMGDPAGIGPEIIVKTFAAPDFHRANHAVVIGDVGQLRRAASHLNADVQVVEVTADQAIPRQDKVLPVIPVTDLPADLPLGQVSAQAGDAAFQYVRKAIELAQAGKIAAVATAPLNKEAMHLGGHPYPGHTEILADLTGTQDYAMMLVADHLRVIHISTHVSMTQAIARATTQRELTVIRLAHQTLRRMGIEHPRVAVAGLNPHAGENGLFGQEEIEQIKPAVDLARQEGLDASGPWPGDTVFMQARQGKYDIVVAQYHDQGHIPIKLLGFDTGVNVTVGLPFFRTSVDHGTAFDIAGTGRAEETSMRAAIDLATSLLPQVQTSTD